MSFDGGEKTRTFAVSLSRLAMIALATFIMDAAYAHADELGEISAEQARQRIAAGGHLHIVDIRSMNAYQAGALHGAVHWTLDTLAGMKPEPHADVLLITDRRLFSKDLPRGYRRVWWLRADMAAWKKAGLHIVRIKISPAFVIPRGLCDSLKPADKRAAETTEEDVQ